MAKEGPPELLFAIVFFIIISCPVFLPSIIGQHDHVFGVIFAAAAASYAIKTTRISPWSIHLLPSNYKLGGESAPLFVEIVYLKAGLSPPSGFNMG